MTHPPDPDIPLDDAPDAEFSALLARAGSLPTLRPARDLWPDIAARLEATDSARPTPAVSPPAGVRVLAFPMPRAGRPRSARRAWLAAAAVALAAVSSGATYVATRRPAAADVAMLPAAPTPGMPSPPRAAPALYQPSGAHTSAATRDEAALDLAADLAPRVASPPPTPQTVTQSELQDRGDAAAPSLHAVSRSADAAVPGAAEYDREIADLRAVVAGRHGDLDSATVAVLARNLAIIDTAIAASRAALARDPHSPFLGEQLTRTLGQKVDLLRTAALLPRT